MSFERPNERTPTPETRIDIKINAFPPGAEQVSSLELKPGFNIPARDKKDTLGNPSVKKARDYAQERIAEDMKNQGGSRVEANRNTITIAYDAGIFEDGEGLDNTFYTYPFLAKYPDSAPKKKQMTKHRLISSNITLYGNSHGEKYLEPTTVYLTSGCAPNFMRSKDNKSYNSDRPDVAQYLEQPQRSSGLGLVFKENGLNEYQNTMTLIFKRMIHEQNAGGVNVMILPLLGGGVYLEQLTYDAKKEAREAITKALQRALKELNLNEKNNIKKIIYTIPNAQGSNNLYEEAKRLLGSYDGNIPIVLANADMLDAAQVYSQTGKVGLINPGSDRTIGGCYEDALYHGKGVPGEETIFSLSDAPHIQALDKNEKLLRDATIKPFPDHLRSTFKPMPTSNNESFPQTKTTNNLSSTISKPDSPSLNANSGTSSPPPGAFTPFRVDYKKEGKLVSYEDQARKILEAATVAIAQGYKKVGITYGANSSQTEEILQNFPKEFPKPFTDITGEGQAAVIKKIHNLLSTLEYQHLKKSVYLLPITTINHISGSNGQVNEAMMKRDLSFIETFIEFGGLALGWQNQDSCNRPNAPYPIGEGVARHCYHDTSPDGSVPFFYSFQQKLIGFAKRYEPNESVKNAITQVSNGSSTVPKDKPASVAKSTSRVMKSSAVVSPQPAASAIQSEHKEKDDLFQTSILEKIRGISFTVQDKVITLDVQDKCSDKQNLVVVDVYEKGTTEAEAKQCGSFEVHRQKMLTKDTDIQVIAAMIKAFMEAKPGKRMIITPKDIQAYDNFVSALTVLDPELEKNKADVLIRSVNDQPDYKKKYSLAPNEDHLMEQETTSRNTPMR